MSLYISYGKAKVKIKNTNLCLLFLYRLIFHKSYSQNYHQYVLLRF